MDYGLPKNNCLDYQSNNTTPARSMAIVSDGEVVVFDDIDDNWQGLRLDLNNTTTTQVNSICLNSSDQDDNQQRRNIIQEPIGGSSLCSSPSPTSFPRNTSDFFKVFNWFILIF